MTRKIVQFKLPSMTADPPLASADESDGGRWVVNVAEPVPPAAFAAPFTAEAPAGADNDRMAAATDKRPEETAPPFAAGRLGRDTAQAFVRRAGALTDCGIVLMLGAQAVSREWLGVPFDALRTSIDGLSLMHCRTLSEVVTVQTRLVQTGLEHALARSRRITQISLQTLGEAAQAMEPS